MSGRLGGKDVPQNGGKRELSAELCEQMTWGWFFKHHDPFMAKGQNRPPYKKNRKLFYVMFEICIKMCP